MNIKTLIFSSSLLLISLPSFAGSTLDAAIGGGLGGAAGAAIGNEIGGRNGAIIGGGLGGATGAAIATHDDKYESRERRTTPLPRYEYRTPVREQHRGGFCPPGQRKKGRC